MRIDRRFRGPDLSANGGYACGMFARHGGGRHGGEVAVTLHTPPPQDTEFAQVESGGRTQFWAGDHLVAVVSAGRPVGRPPPCVPPVVAAGAEQGFRGRAHHLFPACFVCGTRRLDGLALRPGPLPDGLTTACLWRAGDLDGMDPVALLWSVLDCPGGWTIDLVRTPMVLSRMTAITMGSAQPDERYVVLGRRIDLSQYTLQTATAVYRQDGQLLAWANARWSVFGDVRPQMTTEPMSGE